MKIILINPQGMCNGVRNAIEIINNAINDPKTLRPIYMLGSLVHNKNIVDFFKEKDVLVLDGKNKAELIDTIERGTVIFTAHGISDDVLNKARTKGLAIIDTTCYNVLKTHKLIKRKLQDGYNVLFLGIKNHPETEAITSISKKITLIEEDDVIPLIKGKTIITNQTTLSYLQVLKKYQEIKDKYDFVEIADEICDATKKRQIAVIEQSKEADICLVVGDKMSNNCQSLKKIVEKENNIKTYLIESPIDLEKIDLKNVNVVAVTSGASTPKEIVDRVIQRLKEI